MSVIGERACVHIKMRALERISGADRNIVVLPARFSGVPKALHLKPTRRCQSRSVETVGPGVLQPLHDWVGFRSGYPILFVKIKILKNRFLCLQYESDTASGLCKRAQPIPKRVGFVIKVGHFMPPVMNLCETVMRGWDGTGTPLSGQFLCQGFRIAVWCNVRHRLCRIPHSPAALANVGSAGRYAADRGLILLRGALIAARRRS